MATCANLDVGVMSEKNGETICTRCVHREVCVHKQTYLEFLKAYKKLHSEYSVDVSFVKKNDPVCNYYQQKLDLINIR